MLKTIYVDDDNVSGPWNGTKEHPYQNITSGLEHTSDNDIVFVQNGTYYEHVVVNKSLSIIGEDKEETIIGGNRTGVVVSVTRSNVAISGFTIQNGSEGIKLHSLEIGACNNITIYGNSITDMIGSCISVLNSYNNSIVGNTISNSSIGINLGPSYSNIIRQNVISNNRGKGIASGLIMITPSLGSYSETDSANKMFENLIIDNQCGVNITNRSGEIIFHNIFVNNTVQAFVLRQYGINATNTWNNRVEGNYWSDYNESDSNYDGTWDTPYVIDELNKDNYPLMGIFHSFNTSLSYYVNVISNSTIEDFRYFESNSTIKIHVSNMTENQTYGFCRICIPKDLITPDYYVEINDGAIEVLHFNNTLYDNDTHRWIYFAYEHSILEIVIVPEFPSFLVLPLFMIATLLAVTVYKRKHQTRNKKREV